MGNLVRAPHLIPSLAMLLLITALGGCRKTLTTSEYVPHMLDALEANGVFNDPPRVVQDAIANRSLPPSWQVDEAISIWLERPGIRLGMFHHPHWFAQGYFSHAVISPVLTEDDEFFQITIHSTLLLWLGVPGAAIVHATSRDDARVIAHGRYWENIEHAWIKTSGKPGTCEEATTLLQNGTHHYWPPPK